MAIYLTTDTHFNHKKILDYCSRPADYEQKLKREFCGLNQNDTLIHLGDICIGNDEEVHETIIIPMASKKILVRGNHDKKSNSWYLRNGWDFVCETFYNKYFGVNVLFSHRPRTWDGYFDVNIHGHLHDLSHRLDEKGGKLNHLISLEFYGYVPLSLRSILEPIKSKMVNQ